MSTANSAKYSPLYQDQDEGAISGHSLPAGPTKRPRPRPIHLLAALLAFFLGMGTQYAITKSFFGQIRSDIDEPPHELPWHHDLHPQTEWIKFEGGLYSPSEYRGTPQKSIDEAWARYTTNPWFNGGAVVLGVTEDDIRRSRKAGEDEWFNSTVRLDEQNGGQYMATLEIFHQMHCLNEIRRYTYPEYYERDIVHHLREHVDHCIDMIRQVLMCHVDTGLITFHWTEDKDAATPDFSTWHRCRNPEEVLKWAHDHEAPVTHSIIKPSSAITMPNLDK